MVGVLLYSFLLNGIEVVDFVLTGTKIINKYNSADGDNSTIALDTSIISTYNPVLGDSVVVSRGVSSATEQYRLRGKITKIGSEDGKIIISCSNDLINLKYDLFTASYDKNIDVEAGELSAIFSDIISGGGLTPSVVDSGTGVNDPVVDKFISNDQSRYDRAVLIGKILNWAVGQDYDANTIYLQPKGYTVHATTLQVGVNVYNNPFWDEDLEPVRNKITVKGAYQIDNRQESFDGTGSQDTFTLANTPDGIEVLVDDVRQVLGVVGSSDSFDYSLDTDLKTITFVAGSIPGAGSDNVVVNYGVRIPTPVTGTDLSSVALYGVTRAESYNFDDIRTLADAQLRLSQILNFISIAPKVTELITDDYNIRPNYLVTVADPQKPRFDGSYIVKSVTINYPDVFDVVKIGSDRFDVSQLFDTIDQRLRALEDQGLVNESILTDLISLIKSFRIRRRQAKLQSVDVSSVTDILVWGDSSLGFFNNTTQQWGNISSFTVVDDKVVPGNNVYREFFVDDTFEGTGSATWNTSTKQLTFTSGQSKTTGVFAKGSVYVSFNVSIGSITGSVLVEISGDNGSSYQTVTLDTTSNFTNCDGTGVIIRITENDSSTAIVQPTYLSTGEFNLPGMSVVLSEV